MRFAYVLLLVAMVGSTSVGSLGLITKARWILLLRLKWICEELGPAEGCACRYFAPAVIPWGNSDIQNAADRALAPTGGDALVNVSTATSLYGVFPIYNVFSFTCTTVKGTAIKF
jgi:hypothetical protein